MLKLGLCLTAVVWSGFKNTNEKTTKGKGGNAGALYCLCAG